MRKNWKSFLLNYRSKRKREDGFTLLEVIVSLSITSLCFLLLSVGITQVKTIQSEMEDDKQIEWHLFLNQLEYYLQDSELVSVTRDELTVKEWNEEDGRFETVTYTRPQSNRSVFIRRLRNGNQRMLSQVNWVRFSKNGDGIKVEGFFQNGELYTAQLIIESWKEDEK